MAIIITEATARLHPRDDGHNWQASPLLVSPLRPF